MLKNKFYLFVAFIAAFAGILFGFDTGVISGAILFISKEFHLSPQMNGLVVSAVLIGAFLGATLSGRLADRFGRKRMLIADAIIFIIGSLGSSLAPNITSLIISRIVVGIAIGISSYIGPLYISEIAPVKNRGALVSLNQLAIVVGILISYIVDYLLAHFGAWRWMFAAGIIPSICLLTGMLLLPHSPRWILSRGEEEQALAILNQIRGHGPQAQQEFSSIKASLAQQKGHWKMLFARPVIFTFVIAGGLAIIQQVTGINTIIYYAPTIFTMAGFHSATVAILATMGIGVILVIFTIIGLPLIDTMGRRPLLMIGLIIMTISLFVLSWSFHFHSQSQLIHWLALSAMVVYIAGFAFSLGPIMWLMIAEIFPLRIRGLGSSIATCINWSANWIVAITFLTLVHKLGLGRTFGIYAVISCLSILFIYWFVPETKGVTLEEIETNLYAGKKMRELGA